MKTEDSSSQEMREERVKLVVKVVKMVDRSPQVVRMVGRKPHQVVKREAQTIQVMNMEYYLH